jgi:putative phosphoesterase
VRIAIVSDIHGNLTAFEAVLADLRETAPDLILHGGDLADSGSDPVEIVDHIRDLRWPGVVGNTDEMLFRPESFTKFPAVQEQAAWTREELGGERLSWLGTLPMLQERGEIGLVHASPSTVWSAPMPDVSDDALEGVYGPLGQSVVVYGHVHRAYVRKLRNRAIANTGSVSLSHDGDWRAAYLLIDDSEPQIRRVEYNLDSEIKSLMRCGIPHAEWIAKMLVSASVLASG